MNYPTISLLGLLIMSHVAFGQQSPDSKLLFTYDAAGNQVQRFYCPDANCNEPTPPLQRVNQDALIEDDELTVEYKNNVILYPNPVSHSLVIRFSDSFNPKTSIKGLLLIYNINGAIVLQKEIPNSSNSILLDVSNLQAGVYYTHMHLNDNTTVTKSFVKN